MSRKIQSKLAEGPRAHRRAGRAVTAAPYRGEARHGVRGRKAARSPRSPDSEEGVLNEDLALAEPSLAEAEAEAAAEPHLEALPEEELGDVHESEERHD